MSKLKILPSGLASDDEENCLVADSKNNRLVVFNRELQMTKVRGTTPLTNKHIVNKFLCASDHDCRARAPAAAGHPAGGPPGVRGLQRRGGGRPARRGQVQAAGRQPAGLETITFPSRYDDFNELF